MDIPVLGLVENMSYVKCPDCGKEIHVFGESHIEQVAKSFGYDLLARIPMDAQISAHVDAGVIEQLELSYFDGAVETIEKKLNGKK